MVVVVVVCLGPRELSCRSVPRQVVLIEPCVRWQVCVQRSVYVDIRMWVCTQDGVDVLTLVSHVDIYQHVHTREGQHAPGLPGQSTAIVMSTSRVDHNIENVHRPAVETC